MQQVFSLSEVVIVVMVVLAVYTALLLLLGSRADRGRQRRREHVEVERAELARVAFTGPVSESTLSAWKVVLARLAVEDLLPPDQLGRYQDETNRFMVAIPDYDGEGSVESVCMAACRLLQDGRAHYPSVDGLSDPGAFEVARVDRYTAEYLNQRFDASPSAPGFDAGGRTR